MTPTEPTASSTLLPPQTPEPAPAHDAVDAAAVDAPTHALHELVAALETRRAVLGDTVTDAALAPLRERLAALAAQRHPEESVRRLRQVSVLFLDLVGSTQLIQHLEPEDVQSVVDGALAAFTGLVRQHGGEVLRYAGDNIKAAFGADGTREDDAERAVNCGVALLHEARQRGEAVQQAHGLASFDARVGIHTGAVVRGGGVEQDNSLSGLAVNIAARMEQAAAPGTLRISMDTYRGSCKAASTCWNSPPCRSRACRSRCGPSWCSA